jgi:hypothetical protein
VDLVVTDSTQADITVGKKLLGRFPASVKTLLADGAFDGFDFRLQAHRQGIRAIVPPPSNAQLKSEAFLDERNDAIRIIQVFGTGKAARTLWGKLTGYCHRVKAESAFSRLKRLFGESVFSRDAVAQLLEVWLKALLSNQWLNLRGV